MGGFWLPHSPAIVQILLSSVKFSLSLSEDYFCALQNDILLQLFNVFYASKKCILQTTVLFEVLLSFSLLILHNILGTK
jgi:hypothetical protein